MPDETIGSRLSHAWNAFMGRDPTQVHADLGPSSYVRPDRFRFYRGNDKSVVSSIYNRISMDVANVNIEHVKLDDDNRSYVETIRSGINYCLNTEANIDQTSNAFIQDVVLSMFDEGVVCIMPVETTFNPKVTGSFDIKSMRTAKIKEWFPQHVKVEAYDERIGKHKEVVLPKSVVAIIENPFYTIMNEPNSTLQRLIRLLNQIDRLNEQNAAGKLDLIIQLPYSIKSPARQAQAENRRKSIEVQLTGSQHGIAYIDATEKITQLNRPVENQLWQQATELTSMLYNQLGLTESIFDGTADEQTMLNYYNTTIDPILTAISKEIGRKFLTKTARTQHQAIWYFRDPFKLVPVNQLAEIADKFTRNEILSSNEVRALIGRKPSGDPRADQLRNSNMPDQDQGLSAEDAMMEKEELSGESDGSIADQVRAAVEGS